MIDAALDFDIVAHEYGHGLTWRMIGGMSGPLAGALGEGASDTLAMFMTAASRLHERRCDRRVLRAQHERHPSAALQRLSRDMTYSDVTGSSVHDDGEIYAATMWDLMRVVRQPASRRAVSHTGWTG